MLFHESFSKFASIQPEGTALADEGGSLSYREADELSNDLAFSLREAGLKEGEAAAVLVSRQKEIMLGALSILKAGGVYLPLDEGYPNERLLYMLDNAKAGFLLADRKLWEERGLPLKGRRVLFFDEAQRREDFPAFGGNSDAPAMILYTSGTTGNPKGVLHRHALLSGANDWLEGHKDLALDATSHMGILSGFTFVATNVFMFGVLLAGGTLHIAPDEVKLGTDLLYAYLQRKGITHTFMPSSLAAAMAEEYDMRGVALLAGGEKLPNFVPCASDTRVYNMYGSTELATIFSIRVSGKEKIMPIGYLTRGARALLVDEKLDPVEEGEAGELLLSDPRMSHAYLELPELTAEKWIRMGGELYFRTGDRMRRDAQGRYYILGRMDNMVKLRGFRIETGEVETQVARAFVNLGWKAGQVVVVLRTVNGIDHLACYYESDVIWDSRKITEEIASYLPGYMIPDLWTALKEMPRNANGKVMRDQLPEPASGIHLLGAINSEAELRVMECAGHVLKLEGAMDPDDSFVQLGGDSLRAMELSSLLGEQGIRISGRKILAADSLRSIARSAEIRYERLWSVEEYERVKYAYMEHGEELEQVLPLSPEQDDLICRQLTHPDWPIQEKRFMFAFESRLLEADLRAVLDELSKRHKEMRASVAYHGVSVFQCVITDRRIPLKMLWGGEGELSQLYDIIYEEEGGADLQFSPMFRLVCLDRGQAPSWLFVIVNEISYDASMLRLILAEMLELLHGYYPTDREIASWTELFREAIDSEDKGENDRVEDRAPAKSQPGLPAAGRQAEEICIYSHKPPRKIFFVHTGNTGSAAYYPLAQRIQKDFSFAVVEPYNLYHREDARYGIENIAAKYIEIIKKYQPQGPYILGGWCYGGVVAHEMACQLEERGEVVEQLIMLDSHALSDQRSRRLAAPMQAGVGRSYFETCPLFRELRENGMLEAVISNAAHVAQDLNAHIPRLYHGPVTYFKPMYTPANAKGEVLKYWAEMMKKQAGNYEKYCEKDKLEVIITPREHDEMMAPDALDVIVPKLYEVLAR